MPRYGCPGTRGWSKAPAAIDGCGYDKNIPPKALAFMADRAQSQKTIVVKGASHVLMVSHPKEVASLIETAAKGN